MKADRNIVLSSRAETWVLGFPNGSSIGRAKPNRTITGGNTGETGNKTKSYYYSEIWQEMWHQIGRKTETEWDIKSLIHTLKAWGWEDEDVAWIGPAARGFEFIARRMDTPLQILPNSSG